MRPLEISPRRIPFCPLVVGGSLCSGLLVPIVFEWGQPPASRSQYREEVLVALVVAGLTLVVCAWTCWWKRSEVPAPPDSPPRRLQIGLGELLVAITVIAVLCAVAPLIATDFAPGLVAACVLAVVGWSCWQGDRVVPRMIAMLAAMFLPFCWVLTYRQSLAWLISIGPGVLPIELIRSAAALNTSDVERFLFVPVVAELLLGMWLVRRSGMLSVLWTLFLFISSCLSSLALHALCRI